jgi:hypothetical protein
VAALAALLIPRARAGTSTTTGPDEPAHAELGLVAAGTVVGDNPE